MNKLKYLVFAILLTSKIWAQNGIVKYKLIYRDDTNYQYFNMSFDKSSSFYEQNMDSLKIKTRTQLDLPISNETEFVYKNYTDKTLIFKQRIALDFYTVKDTIVKIDWQILEETKKIGNYVCNKAIGKYRGINYTAWFSPQLAAPFGPWKIGGLSGIILELYNEDERLHIVAYEINMNKNPNEAFAKKINQLTKSKKIDLKKYIELKKTENQMLEKYYETLFERGSFFGIESSNPLILEKFEEKTN